MRGKETTDQIFSLKTIFQKSREYNINFKVMMEMDVPNKLVQFICVTMKYMQCVVRVEAVLSDVFTTC